MFHCHASFFLGNISDHIWKTTPNMLNPQSICQIGLWYPNLFHPEFLTKIQHSKPALTTIGLFFFGATMDNLVGGLNMLEMPHMFLNMCSSHWIFTPSN